MIPEEKCPQSSDGRHQFVKTIKNDGWNREYFTDKCELCHKEEGKEYVSDDCLGGNY